MLSPFRRHRRNAGQGFSQKATYLVLNPIGGPHRFGVVDLNVLVRPFVVSIHPGATPDRERPATALQRSSARCSRTDFYSSATPRLQRLNHLATVPLVGARHRGTTAASEVLPGLAAIDNRSVTSLRGSENAPQGEHRRPRLPPSVSFTSTIQVHDFSGSKQEAAAYPSMCTMPRFGTVSDRFHSQALSRLSVEQP